MLNQICIRNYAIVDQLDLDLSQGMTVISGETGAGKSIMLDALGLCLGDRADSKAVRQGTTRAEITASFDIQNNPAAYDWLQERELDQAQECILRRIINSDGKSKCYINNSPSPISAVRELSSLLIEIHGQHEHQRLLKKNHQRHLVDAYAGALKEVETTQNAFQNWQQQQQQLDQLNSANAEQLAQQQLLRYQLEELDQLNPMVDEMEQLELQQKQLANAAHILQSGEQLIELTTGDNNQCLSGINQSLQILEQLPEHQSLKQIKEMLSSAQIQLQESGLELNNYLSQVNLDPARLEQVETRLAALLDIARKHKVSAEKLPELQQQLAQDLAALDNSEERLEELKLSCEQSKQEFLIAATALSKLRKKAVQDLQQQVDIQLKNLGMNQATFGAEIHSYPETELHAKGLEEVEFILSANPGQPGRPLNKVASGGELSRISLAIQVVTAQTSSTPSLMFDEVDVGIGGGIAEVVGRLLRQLGKNAQVLSVTHQPQVASQGHQHLFVSKSTIDKQTYTQVRALSEADRIEEIARMLGGIEITQRSLEHAQEMLTNVS